MPASFAYRHFAYSWHLSHMQITLARVLRGRAVAGTDATIFNMFPFSRDALVHAVVPRTAHQLGHAGCATARVALLLHAVLHAPRRFSEALSHLFI